MGRRWSQPGSAGTRSPVRGRIVPLLAGSAALALSHPGGDAASSLAFGVPQGLGASRVRGFRPMAGKLSGGGLREPVRPLAAGEEDMEAPPAAPKPEVQLSSVAQSSVNLVKNIVGAGVLSLPAGVAAFSSDPRAVVPSLSLTLLFGLASAYGFVLIADACKRTGETTYQDTWAKAVGKRTAVFPLVACLAKAIIGCVCFQMILGDCLSLLLSPLGLPSFAGSRSAVIMILTVFILFPLCTMKSLAPLAKFSVLGVLSNVYIAGFCVLRAFDGSYAAEGALRAAAPIAPKFATFAGSAWGTASDPGIAVLLSILSTAFLAHYNAPLFYEQLAPGADGKKDKRFLLVSVLGFSGAALFFGMVMGGGFLTFGKASMGLILNNYAVTDVWASVARGMIAVSLITAYPIVFFSLRKLVIRILGKTGDTMMRDKPVLFTALQISVITAIALSLRDLGKLAALAGACFGSFLIYIAPAMMVIGAQRKGLGPRPKGAVGWANRALQCALIPCGVALAYLGVVRTLSS